MQSDYDGSASGYIVDSFEGISQEFTDVEILNTSETNVVARAKRYGRWWLLKGLNRQVANEVAYQQRLRKELELLIQLQHPFVVAATGLEHVDGVGDCIVMEYVEGKTLKEWLQAAHPRKERRRVAMEMAEAVGYIHSKGIVHRDLKPENIIITSNGDNVKLIDFGLADTDSHTILKQPAGTLKYMAPEQMQTAVADVRNDIYSLGVIFSLMNLKWGAITKRCQLPLERRYQNVFDLTDAIKKREKRNSVLAWTFIILLVLVLAIMVYAQSVRVGELSRQVDSSRQDQVGIQERIQSTESSLNDSLGKVTTAYQKLQQKQQAQDASLNDSLEKVTTAYQKLQQKQQTQDAKRKRIEDAIAKGRTIIDKAMHAAGVKQHLDTLKNFVYFRQDVFGRINDVYETCNQYLKTISKDFTENEMAEITNALLTYEGNKGKELVDRFTKMKEAYDKAIMQGN